MQVWVLLVLVLAVVSIWRCFCGSLERDCWTVCVMPEGTIWCPVPSLRTCADLEGGCGVRTSPWNLQSLISPILLEMKKLVIFHICALPQLYVKQNQSYIRLDPPWKNFLDPRLEEDHRWLNWIRNFCQVQRGSLPCTKIDTGLWMLWYMYISGRTFSTTCLRGGKDIYRWGIWVQWVNMHVLHIVSWCIIVVVSQRIVVVYNQYSLRLNAKDEND